MYIVWNVWALYQKNSRRLWRSWRRKSSSVPAGAANFPAAVSLPESAQTLAGIAFRAAGKSGNNFPAASKFAGKPFQQGISDRNSLLEFSDCSVKEKYLACFLSRPCLRSHGELVKPWLARLPFQILLS